MSNPGNTSSTVDILPIATPVAILFFAIAVILFMFKDSIGSVFSIVLWGGFPVVGYIICSGINILVQYMACRKTDVAKAFLGGLPILASIVVALGISSISYFRVPVASVFAPLFIGKSVDITKNGSASVNSLKNTNSKECCTPRITLEGIEDNFPVVAGINGGFYLMFAVLFGFVFGNGVSSIC